MSIEKHSAHPDPEFFPENVEFLGFMGGWDCSIGIDTVHKLFYLIRTSDLIWTGWRRSKNIPTTSSARSVSGASHAMGRSGRRQRGF